MRLSLASWNTSLSPLGKQSATEAPMKIATGVIRYLTQSLRVDFLALGEISKNDVDYFRDHVELNEFDYYDGTSRQDGLRFDVGAFYRSSKLFLVDQETIKTRRSAPSLKLANRLDFQTPNTDKLFRVFVSHWPSRIWCEKNGEDRHVLGIRLRDEIEQLKGVHEEQPYIVLMGDYNDEPFDASLSGQLMATRDRSILAKDPTLLYNPFWRLLGEQFPYDPGDTKLGHCGSYYHSKGLETRWRTFDQIIFSSAFLGRGEWRLLEKHTAILQPYVLIDSVSSNSEIFDHFPIMSVIESEDGNG